MMAFEEGGEGLSSVNGIIGGSRDEGKGSIGRSIARFDLISDLCGTSYGLTISSSVDRSRMRTFSEEYRYFGFSWMTDSIAESLWIASRNALIRPVKHLKALFKSQQK
jgi:hypothetical protein